MISIIVSSQKKAILDKLEENIRQTIGETFELIGIDNAGARFGICKAYNIGIDQAKFDIICFMHEDISFETVNWGKKLIEHLSNQEVGLIGVAGGDTKSWVPSSWSSLIYVSEVCLVQHFKNALKPPERIKRTGYPDNLSFSKPVACLDGVFMCTRRDVLDKYRFDEITFQGFHGYDIDFSLQVSQSFRVCAISDIVLHHYSDGSFNKEWLQNAIKLSDKWRKRLPLSVRDLRRSDYVHQHWSAMRVFLQKLTSLGYSQWEIIYYFLKYSITRYFHLAHFLHFFKNILIKEYRKVDPEIANMPLAEQNYK
jgi:glycosyltransferase involved in cell wall biosynthesis